jgi:uncharacterized protein YodC (DUF2158 family)
VQPININGTSDGGERTDPAPRILEIRVTERGVRLWAHSPNSDNGWAITVDATELANALQNLAGRARWKTGDKVQLNSGGSPMTVREYDPKKPGHVICDWRDGTKAKNGSYLEMQLKEYEDDDLLPILRG